MISEAEVMSAELGYERVELYARKELPELIRYWGHRGFTPAGEDTHGLWLARVLPLRVEVPDAESMQRLGERLAEVSRPGDVIILSGALGAGKTTLTQGIGRGLHSDGPIISPTFVISRVHRSSAGARAWCTSMPTDSARRPSSMILIWTPSWSGRSR